MSAGTIDLDQLEREHGSTAVAALVERILAREQQKAPHSDLGRAIKADRVQRSAKARFDAVYAPPTEGPVCEAGERGKVREALAAERMADVARLGRFYIERHEEPAGFRIMDRLTSEVAYFLLPCDGTRQPRRLEGYARRDLAVSRVRYLERYFAGLGLPCTAPARLAKPPRPIDLATSIIPDELWETLKATLPPPPHHVKGMPRAIDDRVALAGIVYALRHGIKLTALPAAVGCSGTPCLARFEEWCEAGTWDNTRKHLVAALVDAAAFDWSLIGLDTILLPEQVTALLAHVDTHHEQHGTNDTQLCAAAHLAMTVLPRARRGARIRQSTSDALMRQMAEPCQAAAVAATVSPKIRACLLARAETHLSLTGMSASNLGLRAAGNAALIRRLRRGDGINHKTAEKLRAFLDQ